MAGSRRNHDPNQYTLDFQSAYEERMALLRGSLQHVDFEAMGLSNHRWRQLRELLLAVRCFGDVYCAKPTKQVRERANLTRRQFYAVRELAIELGLLTARRRWRNYRQCDTLSVELAAVRKLPRCAARGTEGNQGELRGTKGNYQRSPLNPLNPLNPKDPPPPANPRRTPTNAADWDAVAVDLSLCGVQQTAKAIESLAAHGATPDEARALIAAWRARCDRWRDATRPIVLYRRLGYWRPGQSPEEGWPPSDDKSPHGRHMDIIRDYYATEVDT
jgi:hypothetical protein